MKDWNIRDFLSSTQGERCRLFQNNIQFGRIFRSFFLRSMQPSFVPCYAQDSGTSAASKRKEG